MKEPITILIQIPHSDGYQAGFSFDLCPDKSNITIPMDRVFVDLGVPGNSPSMNCYGGKTAFELGIDLLQDCIKGKDQ